MKDDELKTFFCFVVGILLGAIISIILIRATAVNAMGFGLECANIVLNNPEMFIDTTYTIHQQDTTITYHFVKDSL